ncbi:MAG: ABC transporter permease [Peptococcaceae bacterium]|nr:ABC transporter permease [Peptococcaceae bacterium]
MELIIKSLAIREWQYILRNKRLFLIMCVMPTVYILLFGYMYIDHTVNNISTVVLDYSNTGISRSIIQSFDDSDRFDVKGYVHSEEEIREAMGKREYVAALILPGDLEQNLKKGTSSEVLVVVNGSNMLFSNSVMSSANEIISTISAGISTKMVGSKQGISAEAAMGESLPLSFRTKIWYNPTFNYTNFLLLGLMATAIQQMVFLYVAVSFCREKELNLFGSLLKEYKPYQLVAGKIAAYLLINLLSANLVLSVCIFIYKIPFRGSLLALELLYATFIIAISGLGIFLSLICKSELEATQLSMLVAVPSFLFSGFTWPSSSMHGIAKILNIILPLTYLVNDVRNIALLGIGLKDMYGSILVLMGMAAVFLPVSTWLIKKQAKNNSENKTGLI